LQCSSKNSQVAFGYESQSSDVLTYIWWG
jgi:hypothetical protein